MLRSARRWWRRRSQFGGVDILLNNAGTSAAGAFEKVGDDAWQADFDLKVMGAVRMSRLVIPHMKKRGGGRIINVTNVGGKAPRRRLPTSVSRAAGINLTKSLANEYAADRILVNTICIGLVKSGERERRAKDGDVDAYYAESGQARPGGTRGRGQEFARSAGASLLRAGNEHHGDGLSTFYGGMVGGEDNHVIVGGVLPPPGATMFEKKRYLETHGGRAAALAPARAARASPRCASIW